VIGINCTLQFQTGWENEKESLEHPTFRVKYQTDLNPTGKIQKAKVINKNTGFFFVVSTKQFFFPLFCSSLALEES